ncbi:hypothetical protein ACFLQ0_06790, partial [Nitrospinota bacterium]
GFGEMGSGEGGECLKIAQKKGGASQPSATSKSSTGSDVMKSVEGGVKSVGEGLKKLFGR